MRASVPQTYDVVAAGLNASPGAAAGAVVFDAETAVEWSQRGKAVMLVRNETARDLGATGIGLCRTSTCSCSPSACRSQEMIMAARGAGGSARPAVAVPTR